MTDRETLRPEWQHSGVTSQNKFLNANGRRLYPTSFAGHDEFYVEYTYEKQAGRQRLIAIEYGCEECGKVINFEDEDLYNKNDWNIGLLRGWMHGHFVEQNCD